MKTRDKEKIWNFPNFITFARILLTFLTLYFIFGEYPILYIVISFSLGMITDFLDGQIARKFNLTTEFGRNFDIIADRFLMISTVVGLIFYYSSLGLLSHWNIIQIFMIMSREIFTFPFVLVLLWTRKPIPQAKFIGKLTTCLQGFAFPSVLLGIYYMTFAYIGAILSITTLIVGIISAATFIKDIKSIKK